MSIHEPHEREHADEANERDGGLAQEEAPVGHVGEAPHKHVLWIARERGHTPDIGGRSQGHQVRDGWHAEPPRHAKDERGQHHAHHVVHKKCGEPPGGSNHRDEETSRRPGAAHRPHRDQVEKPRES